MREQVHKQRSDCNRKFVRQGDFPEDFQEAWNRRKTSDFNSRKDAAHALYQIMKGDADILKEEIQTLKQQLDRFVAVAKCQDEYRECYGLNDDQKCFVCQAKTKEISG